MSIAGSLSSALSGLMASARAAEVVSSNVANATTEGYGRRVLLTSARTVGSVGQGVKVTGVYRNANMVVIGDRRFAQASLGDRQTRADFLKRLESTLGTPDQAQSLSGRISALDTTLIEAASRPESEARLSNVMESARSLVNQLDASSKDIQSARATADHQIASEVMLLNRTLDQIAEVNTQIRANFGTGRDTSSLMDQRQQMVDSISSIIPLREVARESGQIALYARDGAVILDGRRAEFGFTPTGFIAAEMTVTSGALSGLTINGRPITTTGENSPIAGGSLSAHFVVRDELSVTAQSKLDAVARDLVERFSAPGLDTSRAPGDPGLFTDGGAAFVATDEIGLSQRLRINAAADPNQGGALWRLRDGLGAVTPGASGDASLLNEMQIALVTPRNPVSGSFMIGERSLSALAADMLSGFASSRLLAEGEVSFSQTHMDALKILELEDGVDTDQEMQSLLLIEQAYSANAKVVQTVQNLIQLLLEM